MAGVSLIFFCSLQLYSHATDVPNNEAIEAAEANLVVRHRGYFTHRECFVNTLACLCSGGSLSRQHKAGAGIFNTLPITLAGFGAVIVQS